jgi:hypothetical protein
MTFRLQEPEAPFNNATSRVLRREPPAGAGGLQVAGLNILAGRYDQADVPSREHKDWGVPVAPRSVYLSQFHVYESKELLFGTVYVVRYSATVTLLGQPNVALHPIAVRLHHDPLEPQFPRGH